jgi:hypothetical protein
MPFRTAAASQALEMNPIFYKIKNRISNMIDCRIGDAMILKALLRQALLRGSWAGPIAQAFLALRRRDLMERALLRHS